VGILGPIVEVPTSLLAPLIPDHLHRRQVGGTSVRHNDVGIAVPLHCFLQEFQRGSLIQLLRDIGFQDFAFVVDSVPKIMALSSNVGYACLRLTKTSSRCHRHCELRRMDSERRFLIL
jgi:hypothetical protein